MSNANLNNARAKKNDEFYTRYCDVEAELSHYWQYLSGKVVYCNCDDPRWSNFWKYLHVNFSVIGLRRLVSTHIEMNEKSFSMIYEGGNDKDITAGNIVPLCGNGDFRSEECARLLNESDVVITNPPFSLFLQFFDMLANSGKDFIVIGHLSAFICKSVFSRIRSGEVTTCCTRPKIFDTPDGGQAKICNAYWLTTFAVDRWRDGVYYVSMKDNLSNNNRLKKILLNRYGALEYPHYDGLDIIEVPLVRCIPAGYEGLMGVPLTFLADHDTSRFDIVARDRDITGDVFAINGNRIFRRVVVRWKPEFR